MEPSIHSGRLAEVGGGGVAWSEKGQAKRVKAGPKVGTGKGPSPFHWGPRRIQGRKGRL